MPELQNSTATKSRDTAQEERVVGLVLRIGAYLSIALIVIGGALHLAGAGLLAHRIVAVGLLVLMSTPITRVLTAGIVFLREGDRRYALVSLGVFLILILTSLLAALKVMPTPR
jgi:uncharacterized membrane protein